MICKICHGKEFILTSTGNEQVYAPCKCRVDKDVKNINKNKLILAGIPKTYWDFTPESYKTIPFDPNILKINNKTTAILNGYIENSKKYMDIAPKVIWIYGKGVKAGRTAWAILLGKELISNSAHKVKFIVMQDLVTAFTNFDDKKIYFEDLNRNNIFIIDNAFNDNRFYIKGDYVKINLYNWLNTILNEGKFLICTSDKSVLAIENTYSECKSVLVRDLKELELKGISCASK